MFGGFRLYRDAQLDLVKETVGGPEARGHGVTDHSSTSGWHFYTHMS